MGLISRVSSRTYRNSLKMLRQSIRLIVQKSTTRSLSTTVSRKAITDVSDVATFEKNVLKTSAEKTVIVDFHAGWRGPCRMLAPVLKAADEKHENLEIVKIDVDEPDVEELCIKYKVQSIPLVLFFKGGEQKYQKVGMMDGPALDAILSEL